jgi:uncharacterized protein GlcG (DUF336 family)
MSLPSVLRYLGVFVLALTAGSASAQQLAAPYGGPISGDAAKKIAAAALAEARKNNWRMAAAIVDPSGELVYFEKVDGTQAASTDIAIDKARSSARFKRPTKAFQDALALGGVEMRYLGLRGVVPAEGGVPIVMDGKLVGAIGVSGGTGAQDERCAEAGVAALK